MQNIEIKAKVNDINNLLEKIKSLKRAEEKVIHQRDIFFNFNKGRFKLRQIENDKGELIYYERPNIQGPKLCSYEKCKIPPDCVEGITKVLKAAVGEKGTVKKERHLFVVDQTTIHVDKVEGLGNFVELEVSIKDGQTLEEGQQIAEDLMKKLEINKEDLTDTAYIDLLQNQG